MNELIQPKVLKGFRDFLPENEIARALLIDKLTDTFRKHGFVPIDTPALEYSEILLRKSDGETEKQVFRFEDNGGRDVSLRFDLTVPFARFVAEHREEIYFPFKRYHIAKVWRGEKPQQGRYREFVQCDFDIIGSDSAAVDFEILDMMRSSLAAIGVKNIKIRISHRGIFNRFLTHLSLQEKSEEILRLVDKKSKIGEQEVKTQLAELTGTKNAETILLYINGAGSQSSDYLATLELLETLAGGPDTDTQRMKDIYTYLHDSNILSDYIFDPSITRGLDYYTGIVYETFLQDLPSIGSVCSGGRYDNLAGMYMKDKISGVGASIGLDRLIAGLEALGLQTKRKSFTDALIFCQKNEDMGLYQKTAHDLREMGLFCEVFPEPKKMPQQYSWAEKKAIRWGLSIEEINGTLEFTLKNLETRETIKTNNIQKIITLILAK